VRVPGNFSAGADLLNGDERFSVQQGCLKIGQVPACWGRILWLVM
jgi:hypothetical protein